MAIIYRTVGLKDALNWFKNEYDKLDPHLLVTCIKMKPYLLQNTFLIKQWSEYTIENYDHKN